MKHLSAYVDFTDRRPLPELAAVLSQRLFAGLPFIGLQEGLWDEVPALRLAGEYLGLRVELGGEPGETGGFTLQLEPLDFPWEELGEEETRTANVDLSAYVRRLLSAVEGLRLAAAPEEGSA